METMPTIINPHTGKAVTEITATVQFTYDLDTVIPDLLADRDDNMKGKEVTFAEVMAYVGIMAKDDFTARPFPTYKMLLLDKDEYGF